MKPVVFFGYFLTLDEFKALPKDRQDAVEDEFITGSTGLEVILNPDSVAFGIRMIDGSKLSGDFAELDVNLSRKIRMPIFIQKLETSMNRIFYGGKPRARPPRIGLIMEQDVHKMSESVMVTCEECGTDFEAGKRNARYCPKCGSDRRIKEAVYGNMTTVFHRTSISDLVNKVFDSGFKPGDGAMYGIGFYSTYELESQLRENMTSTYGPIIVKFTCPISTFFVFDYEEFIKSPNFKKLGKPSSDDFLKAQFEFFKMDYAKFDFSKKTKGSLTSETALWCTKNIPNFQRLCEGIIFTGSRDGKVLVSYNTKIIYPLSYSSDDGETWEKVEKNLDYLKKISKIKNRFVPNLTIKPEDFKIPSYEFDQKGFLNVKGGVNLTNKKLTSLPFKFGKVEGDFRCAHNNLTSLKGAPKEVGGAFYCYNNNLTSLEGAPEKVEEAFDCSNNNLTSLQGAPKEVGWSFSCNNNNLTSLQGAPEKVGWSFNCSDNNLTSLQGAPEKVGGYFNCNDNNLTSLQGAPKEVKDGFYCYNNSSKFTEKDVKSVCKVGDQIFT